MGPGWNITTNDGQTHHGALSTPASQLVQVSPSGQISARVQVDPATAAALKALPAGSIEAMSVSD